MTLEELQLNKNLYRDTSQKPEGSSDSSTQASSGNSNSSGSGEVSSEYISSGELFGDLFMVDGFLRSKGFVANTSGWTINADGTAQFTNITLTGGMFKFGKTAFSDNSNNGYYIGPEGIYIGAANDVSKLKYEISTGLFDFVGTISNLSTLSIASAINANGQVIADVINAKLDTSASQILGEFSFGESGAIQIGQYAEFYNGDIRITQSGIVARNSAGANTFTLDAETGNATFGGTLSAPSGTLGLITAANIDISSTGYIKGGQTDFGVGSGFFLGYSGGDYKMSLGTSDNYLKWDGTYLKLKGSFDVGANGVINNSSFLVANLPVPPQTVGFNLPTALE